MTKHVYDDEKLTLVGKVDGTPTAVAKIKTVDFVVTTKVGTVETAQAPHSEPIKVGFPSSQATYQYTPTAVADDKDSYELRYEARISPPNSTAPLVKQGEEDYVLWPSTVEVTFTADDNKAHKGCKFKVVQGTKTSGVKTAGDDGKWTERLEKATFSVVMQAPYVFDGAVTHVGRKRSYKVKKSAYTFEFIDPVVEDATKPTKQYVNLDVDGSWSKEKPFGNQLTFKVGAAGDTKRPPSERHAKQDELVYIEVVFSNQTKRDTPRPKLLDDGLDGSAVMSNSNKTWKGKAKLDASGQATFKVELGYAGGDECKVKIGADNTCADATLDFVNWRRLFYELMYCEVQTPSMSDAGSGKHDIAQAIKNEADTRLGAAFLEYKCTAYHKYTSSQAIAKTLRDPEYCGRPSGGRKLIVLGGKLSKSDPVAFNAAAARTIHVKLADSTYSTTGATKGPWEATLTATTGNHTMPSYSVPLTLDVAGHTWRADIATPDTYKSMTTATFEMKDTSDVVNKPYVVTVREKTQNVSLDLIFARDSKSEPVPTLSSTEQAKIDPWILGLLDVAKLRKQNNALVLQISRTTNAGTITATVQAALTTSFNSQKTEIYTHPGLDETGVPHTGAVDAAWITEVSHREVKITLPTGTGDEPGNFVGALSGTKCPVIVEYSAWQSNSINGNSNGGRQLFKIVPGRTDGAHASTLCHELGHSMGMTIMAGKSKKPSGTDAATHVDGGGRYYINGSAPYNNGKRNLGKGAHCADGVPGGDRAHSKFNNKKGSCIMFHEGGDADTRPAYCTLCKDYVRARKLTDIRTGWAARTEADS